MEDLTIKLVDTETEMEGALGVRFRVFVSEQQVPMEEELDEIDASATHAIAIHNGQVIATGRVFYRDEDSAARIGRMAVDSDWRRHGIGGRLLKFLEQEATKQGVTTYILNAQVYVKDFYAANGYEERGEEFLEADIVHILMRKQAASPD
ncbi:MAG: GNAT family N-acetyltransferase [Chloroflexota bacterium]|jgi:predicted GNAT family N-acyltransferase|nr:GNAT family N-acetyltransferase [Chloroflexota bacterium]MCH2674434.1 GNAT family N-acetyltransferase [Dehalococcoidia bacterium]MCS5669459.1 GNAT family N-acetyltransferase [Dehalococcoidia bacterium]MEC8911374.1 GNAT family N-acetyltransferase [Chloroflexota bacterium]MEC9446314.1 GNAT family N-acetyltransferase [Chloroflexota bacterium]|tara:strand:+ start:1286 stop:1735 length:450 start_codon:yes stop_codon:yes gene_type:complete